MARRGENIRKRKDGRWEARYISSYNLNGKAIYKSVYGKNYKEVKEKLRKAQNGKLNITTVITLQYVTEKFLMYSKMRIKEATFSTYTSIINNHVLPYIGNVQMKRIDNNILNEYIKQLYENGRINSKGGLSPKTIQDIITLVKQIIKYGVANGYLQEFQIMVSLPKVDKKEVVIFSKEEQRRMENYIVHHLGEEYSFLGFLISLHTGIRIGELSALKWNDISFEDNTLSINKTMQRIKNTDKDAVTKTKIVVTAPKSKKSIRTIPLSDLLIEILSQQKRSLNAYVSTGKCNQYIEPRNYERKFKKFLNECKIQDNQVHSLRHTFATNTIRAGADIKTVSELLGHSSVKLTLDLYVHSDITEKRNAIKKVDKWGQKNGQDEQKIG